MPAHGAASLFVYLFNRLNRKIEYVSKSLTGWRDENL